MGKRVYHYTEDEAELRKRIDSLDRIAQQLIRRYENKYLEDLFYMTVIDKSIKLIDSFLFALEKRNITVLYTLLRVQMDCAMIAYASTMVSNSEEFCVSVLGKNDPMVDKWKK